MSDCKDQSCSTGSSCSDGCACNCHSSCSCSSCGCQTSSSSCPSCGCHSSSCSCKSCCSSDDKAKRLLALADVAWMEVLKEKIKDHIRSNDNKIDEMAKIVAQTNHDRWHHKMAKQKCMCDYEESLEKLFSDENQCCKGQKEGNGQSNPPSPPRQF